LVEKHWPLEEYNFNLPSDCQSPLQVICYSCSTGIAPGQDHICRMLIGTFNSFSWNWPFFSYHHPFPSTRQAKRFQTTSVQEGRRACALKHYCITLVHTSKPFYQVTPRRNGGGNRKIFSSGGGGGGGRGWCR
jgi:hypothetical protein